jgi:hypothetical protein
VALLSESMAHGEQGLVTRLVRDATVTARLGFVVRLGGLPSATRALHDRLVAALGQPGSGAQQRP